MKKIVLLFSIIATMFAMTSCKDATQAQFDALGKKHNIKLYGVDGKIIGEWTSTGNVSNEEGSDGWYFEDVATGKLVEVTGTLVITVID